ncbi:hypothetical protein QEZ47_22285 [Aminobacter anthyllidis]|uniref:hypothetical protein n=1 Tax=Aminobacter anthyllidis TaxID=1035067 RepID=UPI002456E007|nr:hypothetical protein [Aminobacter anthyllidis]MDH4988187.1 hypothetical protein [Aminobacter anthyllidis]
MPSKPNRAIEGCGLRRGFFHDDFAQNCFGRSACLACGRHCRLLDQRRRIFGRWREARPSGVEGAWLDAKGTGLSTFAGGSFQTVATDTGQKLSDGTYILTGANSVQINGTSLIRQSPISFNCLLISANQLNCTSSAGQQFTLTRRTA